MLTRKERQTLRVTRDGEFRDFRKAVKAYTHLAAFFLPKNCWLWVSFSFTGKCHCTTLSNNLISWPNHKLWRSYNLKGKKVCQYKLLTKKNISKRKSDTRWIAQCQTEATVFDLVLSISQNTMGKEKQALYQMWGKK